MKMAVKTVSKTKLLPQVTCPHCWHRFPPEQILWISEHTDLLGDPLVGPELMQRFLPTRFTVRGEALDARGFPCHQLACPQCHLTIPRPLLEKEPLFFSIFGAPASGKSYYLAAMTWELRKVLPLQFGLSFADTDPILNRHLNEYEESVFSSANSAELTPLASLIRKTEEQGDLYSTITRGTQTISYPRPCLFSLDPQSNHFSRTEEKPKDLGRIMCLYDNAGESFQPGKDNVASPVTRHLAQSRALYFVMDPTQDARFQRRMGTTGQMPGMRSSRQELLAQEAAVRIQKFSSADNQRRRPLIVILTKFDLWAHLVGQGELPEPWLRSHSKSHSGEPQSTSVMLDIDLIHKESDLMRQLMLETCPEIVTIADTLSNLVTFVPVSAVGWKVRPHPQSGLPSIIPAESKPCWATVPILLGVAQTMKSLVRLGTRKGKGGGSSAGV